MQAIRILKYVFLIRALCVCLIQYNVMYCKINKQKMKEIFHFNLSLLVSIKRGGNRLSDA